ncbi:MAG: TIGR03960 family B12-binding radical SAM protein [Clostridia bacterium]
MNNFEDRLNKILLEVEKPARYTGGEWNTPDMTKPARAKFCFCFPDIYEIGMSNLGVQILYDVINREPDFVAERCFAPWTDMGEKLKENDIPLLSLETKTPLKDFDVVGFSVGFELLYTNILYMLELSHIPFFAKDRDDSFPLIVAGGPCAVNPEPFKDFFDCIVIGEGEEADLALLKLVASGKEQGLSKAEILKNAKGIDGVYVPSQFEDGEKVKKAVVKDFENAPYPEHPLVPNIEVIHDRVTLELYRGCASGCRFCQAGFYYRPIRERSAKRLCYLGETMVKSAGFDEVSLCSLSTSDYTELDELKNLLTPFVEKENITLALPSLRLSSFRADMASASRKSSLTFAPEAGTQRLRNVINKNVSDEEINNVKNAFDAGYDSVKLYFMIGLPTETYEDLDGIAEICNRLKSIYFELKHKRSLTISVSCAVFIPKPGTPFQWEAQLSFEEMLNRQNYLRGKLRAIKGVNFSWHGAETSVLEAALARGDSKLSKVIAEAYQLGAKFDSWSEHFKWDVWTQAFINCGLDMDSYIGAIDTDKVLPWDFIDTGVSKAYLLKEKKMAYDGETTKSCRDGCNACGANSLGRCTICK